MVSSRSFSRDVNAIMMSLCLSKSCLYLSTYAFPSSICVLSLSISFSFASYSYLILFYCSSKAVLNWGVSSIFLPPGRICEFIALILSSRRRFSSWACRNSCERISRALIAAFLSASACFFSASILATSVFYKPPIDLVFASSSYFSFLSSIWYFLKSVL